MIKFTCPNCQKKLGVEDSQSGKTVRCPQCGTTTVAPKTATPLNSRQKKDVPTPPDVYGVSEPTKPCPFCGETILEKAKKCKHCGEFIAKPMVPSAVAGSAYVAPVPDRSLEAANRQIIFASRKKSALLAAILNFIIPGAGEIYCGHIISGIIDFIVVIIFLVATAGLAWFILAPILVISGVIAAGRANRRLARNLTGTY